MESQIHRPSQAPGVILATDLTDCARSFCYRSHLPFYNQLTPIFDLQLQHKFCLAATTQ